MRIKHFVPPGDCSPCKAVSKCMCMQTCVMQQVLTIVSIEGKGEVEELCWAGDGVGHCVPVGQAAPYACAARHSAVEAAGKGLSGRRQGTGRCTCACCAVACRTAQTWQLGLSACLSVQVWHILSLAWSHAVNKLSVLLPAA